MILQLNIKNFALIENLTISFEKGFNIFSGETGAGKSILIDAINFVLGGKFNKESIRNGENKTFVEAIFIIENEKTGEILKKQEIDGDGMVIISREAFSTGKSIVKVNGKSLIISNLKQISETLLDIHGQHENQNLLDVATHINYLDFYGGIELEKLKNEYKEHYGKMSEIRNKIDKLSPKSGDNEKLVDFLSYQIEEIENSNLSIEEEKELQERFSILSNSEKISGALTNGYEILHGDGNGSLFNSLGIVIKELRTVEKHIEKVSIITNSLEEAYYNIEENINSIRRLKDEIFFDENELENINSRMFLINSLKKKYGKTIKDVIEYLTNIKEQYNEIVNSSDIIEELQKELIKEENILRNFGDLVHELRADLAKDLEVKIKKELDYIGLEKSVFKIIAEKEECFYFNGMDKVQFLISTNPGEPLKPLERIVSGGELSRIMLALKTVFIHKDMIPTVIFDEIDSGISGRVAQSVAEKMFEVSITHQVFCVTHLPQIASMSDHHYLISKNVENGKTFTDLKHLNQEEKEYEVARMIGGTEVTKLTVEHSKELINMASIKKIQLFKNHV